MEELIMSGVSQLSICLCVFVYICVWSAAVWTRAISSKQNWLRDAYILIIKQGWLSQTSLYSKRWRAFLTTHNGNKLLNLHIRYISDPDVMKKPLSSDTKRLKGIAMRLNDAAQLLWISVRC